MGFGPDPGMTPNDWSELAARRQEREQLADTPHGREMSAGSRQVAARILVLIAVGLVVYAVLGWLGVIDVPGFTT